MMAKPKVVDDGRTVTVRMPISIRTRGGRKLVLAPNGENVAAVAVHRHIDNAMVKAVARAFRWRGMLENGEYSTVREVAAAEKINETYVGRVLRLTLLAPEIVQGILNGQHSTQLTLPRLMKPFPIEWKSQLQVLSAANPTAAVYQPENRRAAGEYGSRSTLGWRSGYLWARRQPRSI